MWALPIEPREGPLNEGGGKQNRESKENVWQICLLKDRLLQQKEIKQSGEKSSKNCVTNEIELPIFPSTPSQEEPGAGLHQCNFSFRYTTAAYPAQQFLLMLC
jgi:hypothetical protein